jgi:acetolactate synthase-1/2/3 large subunit
MDEGRVNSRRGADALVRALHAAGVARIFTLSGNHIMPLFDAAIDAGIELVHTRHEAAAVHMADAHARLTGEVGVALVTGGPGHANAVSALYTATLSESPVLLLSGHAPHDQLGLGAFQEMAQVDVAAPLCKAAWLCRSAGEAAPDVRRAMAIALAGRPGAVHVSLPTDCLEGSAGAVGAGSEESGPAALPDADARSIVERLSRAKRPLVITGPLALTKRGREVMRRLEDALGIAVVGMESPRGIADPSLGAFAQVLAQADCVLLLGKRLDYTLKFGRSPVLDDACELLQVDPDADEIDRARRAVGSRLVASALADVFPAAEALRAQAKKVAGGWRQEVRAAIDYRPAAWDSVDSCLPSRLHPVQALRPLQAILDEHPDSVVVSDGGEFGQWALACVSAPNRLINGVAGPIGVALPFAIAARLAKPDVPVITILGDGTFGFHAAEFDTAVRCDAPFVAVLGNDARWNAEYQIQLRDYGEARAKGCELVPTRYDRVSVAFGGHGEYVTRAENLLPAVRRSQASRLPACVNVMIDGSAAPIIRR